MIILSGFNHIEFPRHIFFVVLNAGRQKSEYTFQLVVKLPTWVVYDVEMSFTTTVDLHQ